MTGTGTRRGPKIARLVAIAIVAGFELGVFGLIFYPWVTPDYRAYFIDHTSGCWPHKVSGAYEAGTSVSFARDTPELAAISVCGWKLPDGAGSWATGPEALLKFTFPPAGDALMLTIRARAYADFGERHQRVLVAAGDKVLGALEFGSDAFQTKQVTIPKAIAQTSASGLEIKLGLPEAPTPEQRQLLPVDSRRGLYVVAVQLADVGDGK